MNMDLPKTADAVVVGGGIVGVAIARQLARDGLKTVLLEKGAFGGGVSGASLACLGTHMHNLDELPVLIDACRAWKELAADLGDPFEYQNCGQLRFIMRDPEIAVAEHWIAGETKFGLAPELLGPEEVRSIEPLMTGPILAASWSAEAATVNPFLAVRALLADGKRHGLSAFHSVPVLGFLDDGDSVAGVQVPSGTVSSPNVVIAAGPWSSRLAAAAGIRIPIKSRQAQCLASMRQSPSVRTVVGACESAGGVESGYTQIQQARSGQILFNTVIAPKEVPPNREDCVNEVPLDFVRDSIQTLTTLFPSLRHIPLLRSWVRFEATTPDDRFLTGNLVRPGLMIAAGDNGTGFCRALFMAGLISRMLRRLDPGAFAFLYDPARFSELRA